jgi:hypothetical protein
MSLSRWSRFGKARPRGGRIGRRPERRRSGRRLEAERLEDRTLL